MSGEAGLWTLFVSSFLAATLLPGGSEAVLFGVLALHPAEYWPALVVATVGNTVGGMSSYLVGRVIPQKEGLPGLPAMKQYGAPALILSWVPLLGDPLCVAAGWRARTFVTWESRVRATSCCFRSQRTAHQPGNPS